MKPKLNEDQIARARRLHEAGTTFENIGLRLGCAATTVRRALDPEIARQKRLARHQPGAEVKFRKWNNQSLEERLEKGRQIKSYHPGFAARWGWWATEPGLGRVAHGVPNRVDRLEELGNAVVPEIPEMIGRAILSQWEAA
jgi:hypothetical protein